MELAIVCIVRFIKNQPVQITMTLPFTPPPHYRRIAEMLRLTLVSGALRPGDRIISARKLAEREQVSLPTALEALRYLEAEGLIVARPRSGYFVRPTDMPKNTQPSGSISGPVPVTMSAVARSLFGSAEARLVPLGAALPDPAWLPLDTLQRALQAAGRRLDARGQSYSLPPGRADLRGKIAARAALWGAPFGADDLIITAGATQALRLALHAVCQSGDIVAIEQPAYFGTLLLLEDLGLKALQIPTDPQEGLLLDPLKEAIQRHRPAAVIASPTVQNPLGASMSVERKRKLVALLASESLPLIEDDVYGDLAGDWAGAPLMEAAASQILANGDYDRHLRRLKLRIAEGVQAVIAQVMASFPSGTRVAVPEAGFLIWVELPPQTNALEVHRRALAQGIGVSPGPLFSPEAALQNYLRLNCANAPTPYLLKAVQQLGIICHELSCGITA